MKRSQGGFTLIELLAVIGIFALVSAMAVPAFSNLDRSGNLKKAMWEVGGFLEAARSEAMARGTYVWVGFASESDGDNGSTEPVMIVAAVATQEGSTPTDLSSATLLQLGKPQVLSGIRLVGDLDYGAEKSLPDGQIVVPLSDLTAASAQDRFTLNVRNQSYEFSRWIRFSPSGEASVAGVSTMPRLLEIGLVQTRGTERDRSGNSGAIRLSPASGALKMFQP